MAGSEPQLLGDDFFLIGRGGQRTGEGRLGLPEMGTVAFPADQGGFPPEEEGNMPL